MLYPTPLISLLGFKFKGYGHVGLSVEHMIAYNVIPGYDQINYTNEFDPFPAQFWVTGSVINFTTNIQETGTLGLVYNLNPVITNPLNFSVNKYNQGEYFVSVQITLYRVLPWGIYISNRLNITEPWITVDY